MKILAIYDVTGIQEYIFSSNKLKENIGASSIVQNALDEFLHEAIKNSLSGCEYAVDWEKAEKLKIINSSEIKAEIIYIGGGNAMVAYDDIETYKKINRRLSDIFLENTSGMLQVAVAKIETNFYNFAGDQEKLFKELDSIKSGRLKSLPLMGISINQEGITDGLPATARESGDLVSDSAFGKREAYNKLSETYKSLKEWNYPAELDRMITKDESSFIAIVHIDGNNMGKTIETVIQSEKAYPDAVAKLRNMSKQISDIYKETMNNLINKIIHNIENNAEFREKIPFTCDGNILPIRPIVLNGDDVTFVCNSAIAVPCVDFFLKEIGSKKIIISEKEFPLSTCAGIAITKSHFPFYRAYKLAENLCGEAKRKGKIAAQRAKKEVGSWFDFHIVMSGIISDSLSDLRSSHYKSPGMSDPPAIEEYSSGLKYSSYNLLWRPWCISGDLHGDEKKYSWDEAVSILKEFDKRDEKGKLKWPRSKLKTLRNLFLKQEEEVETFVKELESRNLILPDLSGKKAFLTDQRQTPYVDILEIIEHFIPFI